MIFKNLESSVQSYARRFPGVFCKASGAKVFDEDGRCYIDFLAGAGSLNYGHNDAYIKNRLVEYLQEDNIFHSLDLHTVAKRDFLEIFNQHILKPRQFSYVCQFTGPTGTNAVEAAFKLARKVTGRKNIISFTNGFHGVTLGSVAAAGNQFYRKAAGVSTGDVTFMPFDGYFGDQINTIDMMDKLFSDSSSGIDLPAGVIVETIQGEGGINVACNAWLQSLSKICKKYGVLLIVDDIQAGCGRTGAFFSFEEAMITPDIITLSKSLSGSGLPMSLVLIKPELDQWAPGEHNGTFRGNNPAFVTASAAIERYWKDDLLSVEVNKKSKILKNKICNIVNALDGDFHHRGRGLMQGLVCPSGDIANLISQRAFANGLIVETCGSRGHVLKFLMPLTIPIDLMEEGLDILDSSVKEICSQSKHAPVEGCTV